MGSSPYQPIICLLASAHRNGRVGAETNLKENVRDDLVDLSNKLEEFVFREMLEGKLALSGVAGILRASSG